MAKKYEELDFTDDFMFCKVLTNNPELCRELLELIIGRKVGEFLQIEKQKQIEITADGKGIRFDVYSEDDRNVIYDCEMQTTANRNLPKRARYYQGMIDLNLIERGEDYSSLKRSYVIFLCPFDAFDRGLHKYTFTNRCEELPELLLGDEATKIFLCADGKADDVSEEMKEFLQWMVTGHPGNSNLVKSLDDAVQRARDHEKWRLEYMTLLMRDNQMREEGRIEGRKEGREEGRMEGQKKGRIEGRIEVYRNLRKRGFSKKEAADLAEIPESVVEQEEKESE